MFRRTPSNHGLLTALLSVLTFAACSNASEQPIVNQFFTASRLRDNTSLNNFSMVEFDPGTEGIVMNFDITGVGPESRTPLNVKTLAQALDDARAEDTAYSKRKDEFFGANEEAVRRALKAERENTKLKGKDAEVQAAWVKIREEGSQVSRKVGEARSKLAAENAVAQLSLANLGKTPDLKKQDGELVTKEVTVSAPVKRPNGQTEQKTLLFTMRRVVLKGNPDITGRWIITAVKS